MAFVLKSVGADPEIFFLRDGIPHSVEGLLGGTKEAPKPIPGKKDGYAIQEDNVAAEFNIPPCRSAIEFSIAIANGVAAIEKIAKKNKCTLAFVAALHFPKEQLMTPHAMRLGCEPDINAYTGTYNQSPNANTTLRTAAGHVHVGYEVRDIERVKLSEDRWIARALDVYLGLPSLFETEKNERRTMYGKAGAMRHKPYGVEYRTLESFWLRSKSHRTHVFNTIAHAMSMLARGGWLFQEQLIGVEDEVEAAINEHDLNKAIDIMHTFDVSMFPNAG